MRGREFCAHSVDLADDCDICDGKLVCPICKEKTEIIEHNESTNDETYYCRKCHSDFFKKDMVRK